MAMNELKKHDSNHLTFSTYEGGILKWKSEGKPVKGKGASLPVMRQMQIIASFMIFFAFLGAKFITPGLIYLALFVGFGLSLAGFSGFCPMVFFLQKMPWNNKPIETCEVKKTNCCG